MNKMKNTNEGDGKMGMSDIVSKRILELLELSSNGSAEIRRNELAEDIGCVPSQINYVLTSRFTPEHGYTIESRRGGGGYIRITRVRLDKGAAMMHLVNSVGDSIDAASAQAIIGNLYDQKLITKEAAMIMRSAVAERTFRAIPYELRDAFRSVILKNMLLNVG